MIKTELRNDHHPIMFEHP